MGALKCTMWALPRGAEAVPLPHLQEWKVSPTDGDAGLVEFSYPEAGYYWSALAKTVADDVDLSVDVTLTAYDGRTWSDVAIIDSADLDDVTETGMGQFSGLLQSRILDEVVIPYAPAGDQGETTVSGTAGQIVRQLVQTAQARGALAGVTLDFTDDKDSAGQPWARTAVLRFAAHTTYRAMLGTVRGYQLGEWTLTKGRALRIFNVDGGLGVDRTTGANPLTLEHGRDLGDAPRKWRIRDGITALFGAGKDGLYASATDATAQARRGRRIEGTYSFGNTADQGTLIALTQRRLSTQTAGRTEVSHEIPLAEGSPTPLIDFGTSDYVFSATRQGVTRRRVRQITVSGTAEQAGTAAVTMGVLIDEAAVRQQDELDRISSGESISGTSQPPPEVDDGSIPAAPTGLTVNSLWYATNEGVGATAATAAWVGVPDSRVQGYVVEWRYPATSGWSPLGQVEATTVSWSGLRPAATMETRVYAVNKFGRRSAPSAVFSTVLEADGTPPPKLSTPAPYPSLGLAVVPWDGRGSVGEPMPGDFASAEVHISPTSGFTAHRPLVAGTKRLDVKASSTYAGELRAGGELPVDVGVASYGTTMFVVLVGVDRTGNAGPQSAQGSMVPRPVQDGEIAELGVGKLRTGILTALVSIAGKLYAGDPAGAGWEADPAGFRFYGMIAGIRTALLEFVAATATLTIRGQLISNGDDNSAITISPEALPIIRFYSAGWAVSPAFMNAISGTSGTTAVGLNSGGLLTNFIAPANRYSRLYMGPQFGNLEIVNGLQSARGGRVRITDSVGAGGGYAGLDSYGADGTRRAGVSCDVNGVVLDFRTTVGELISRLQLNQDGSLILGNNRDSYLRIRADGTVDLVQNSSYTTGNPNKTFVIDHPLDEPGKPRRWLVHACTESPVAAVEYTGTVEVTAGRATVALPDYFEALVEPAGRTVQLTAVDDDGVLFMAAAGKIENGRFTVRTSVLRTVRVHWHVRGARRGQGFEVEPQRSRYAAFGDGPYRYLMPKGGEIVPPTPDTAPGPSLPREAAA